MKRKVFRRVVRRAAKKAKILFARARRLSINRSRLWGKKRFDVHHFKRAQFQSEIALSNSAYTFHSEAFSLSNNVTNYTEFTNLFDQYRINKVVIKFKLKFDPSAQPSTAAVFPKMWIHADYDDSTIPTTVNDLLQRSNLKTTILQPDREYTFAFTPAILAESFRGATATAYSPKFKQYIDMSFPDTPHYAYKAAIEMLPATGYSLLINKTLYFSCKNVR